MATAGPQTHGQKAPQQGHWDQTTREARREYRRSLPALYRWRRVLVALAAIVVVAVVLALTGNNPVGWVQERWRDLTVDLEPVESVTAGAWPRGTVAATYDVGTVTSPRQGAWATVWPPGAEGTDACGTGPAEGAIVLRWETPTRVRGLDVWAGLAEGSESRDRQPRPRVLAVSWDDQCVQLPLEDTPDRQTVEFDTTSEVNALLVKVDDVYPSTSSPPEDLVAIGGLEVLHRPG